jgi:hypothetical protein
MLDGFIVARVQPMVRHNMHVGVVLVPPFRFVTETPYLLRRHFPLVSFARVNMPMESQRRFEVERKEYTL